MTPVTDPVVTAVVRPLFSTASPTVAVATMLEMVPMSRMVPFGSTSPAITWAMAQSTVLVAPREKSMGTNRVRFAT